ncbi:hypothetical protein AB4Z54_05315 [Streptomyces sp. MCAF7]
MSLKKEKAANAVDWDDLKEEFGFSSEEQEEVEQGAVALLSEVRSYRLAERRAAGLTVAAGPDGSPAAR